MKYTGKEVRTTTKSL